MLGCQLSIAGGVHNALLSATDLHAECVQLFTQNQRQWVSRAFDQQELDLWNQASRQAQLRAIVAHGSYLLNLASPDWPLRRRSIAALHQELRRCEMLGISAVVIHPGAHMGCGEEMGLELIARSLDSAIKCEPDSQVTICLETTAGQGSTLGYRLEQLKWIVANIKQPQRVAVCLDTAHLLAAGYDLTSATGAAAVLEEVQQLVGLERVLAVHMNDSKTPLGSHVDRHQHIGHGYISLNAFATILNHPRLKNVPMILETPKETAPDGRSWDAINLETLRELLRK